jgi:hypothetical protein
VGWLIRPSHWLLPCGLDFNPSSLTGVGHSAHQLAEPAIQCSLFIALAALHSNPPSQKRVMPGGGFGSLASRYGSGRPPAEIALTHRNLLLRSIQIPLLRRGQCREGDLAPSPPDTARVGHPLRLLLLIATSYFAPFKSPFSEEGNAGRGI